MSNHGGRDLVKLHATVTDIDGIGGESFWAQPLEAHPQGSGTYEVKNLLTFAPFSLGDTVLAVPHGNHLEVIQVLQRHPHPTCGIDITEGTRVRKDSEVNNPAEEARLGLSTRILGSILDQAGADVERITTTHILVRIPREVDPLLTEDDADDVIHEWLTPLLEQAQAAAASDPLANPIDSWNICLLTHAGMNTGTFELPPLHPEDENLEDDGWRPWDNPELMEVLLQEAETYAAWFDLNELAVHLTFIYLTDPRVHQAVKEARQVEDLRDSVTLATRTLLSGRGAPLPPLPAPLFHKSNTSPQG